MIQKPAIKPGVAVIVFSEQGAGKNSITTFFSKIVGAHHALEVNNIERLVGRFNGLAARKLLVVCDELGSVSAADGNQLKNLITEITQNLEKKNAENIVINDFSRYVFLTNHRICKLRQVTIDTLFWRRLQST